MSKTLTIIIPSYNTSTFIDASMRTMLENRNIDNLEIIIVDDGSKDNTAELARAYVEKYPQNVRLISKANGGHGSAINVGVQEATGKYFKVIDGDDYVDTEELAQLIDQLKCNDSDLFVSYYTTVSDTTGEETVIGPQDWSFIPDRTKIAENCIINSEQALEKIYFCIHEYQVERSGLSSWTRWWSLHRCRPVLLHL